MADWYSWWHSTHITAAWCPWWCRWLGKDQAFVWNNYFLSKIMVSNVIRSDFVVLARVSHACSFTLCHWWTGQQRIFWNSNLDGKKPNALLIMLNQIIFTKSHFLEGHQYPGSLTILALILLHSIILIHFHNIENLIIPMWRVHNTDALPKQDYEKACVLSLAKVSFVTCIHSQYKISFRNCIYLHLLVFTIQKIDIVVSLLAYCVEH